MTCYNFDECEPILIILEKL